MSHWCVISCCLPDVCVSRLKPCKSGSYNRHSQLLWPQHRSAASSALSQRMPCILKGVLGLMQQWDAVRLRSPARAVLLILSSWLWPHQQTLTKVVLQLTHHPASGRIIQGVGPTCRSTPCVHGTMGRVHQCRQQMNWSTLWNYAMSNCVMFVLAASRLHQSICIAVLMYRSKG